MRCKDDFIWPARMLRAGLFRAALSLMAFGGMTLAAQAAVDISDQPTKNMSCSAGVCSPTAKSAVLNVDHLARLLKRSDVKVTTGNGAVTIEVTAPLSWATTSRLTLDANCNVSIKAPVTVAGTGAMTIVTNDGGSGCDLLFFPGGKIDFWDLSSSLVIDPLTYTLVGDIRTLAQHVVKKSKSPVFLALANDYDAKAEGRYNKPPVYHRLLGIAEGLGHTIRDLTIDAQVSHGCVGLFSTLDGGSLIRDFILANANVAGHGSKGTGTLLGCNKGGYVQHSSADGIATGGNPIGGLVGTNGGWIMDSSANIALTANCCATMGGLAGVGGRIIRSHASGSVSEGSTALSDIGGLAGTSAQVDQSFATGNVIVGDSVLRSSLVGGLIGELTRSTVTNSYSLGLVQGGTGSYVGGLAGDLGKQYAGTVASSYSVGAVSSKDKFGGFLGRNKYAPGRLSNAYWDLDTSGTNNACGKGDCSGVTGLTDTQLKSGLPAGFDPAIWGQDPSINNGYPYLLANPPPT